MELENLFASISKENLNEAKELREKIDKRYWIAEIDNFYRYFHDSFKMYFAKNTACGYLECILALVGEGEIAGRPKIRPKEITSKLRELDFDERFIKIISDGLEEVKFHQGGMERWEWRNMAAAVYSAQLAADASMQYVGDLLNGHFNDGALDYYQALFIYLWNVPNLRFGNLTEVVEKAAEHGSEDIKEIYRPWKEKIEEIRQLVEEVINDSDLSLEIDSKFIINATRPDYFYIRIPIKDGPKISDEKHGELTLKQYGFFYEGQDWDAKARLSGDKVMSSRSVNDNFERRMLAALQKLQL